MSDAACTVCDGVFANNTLNMSEKGMVCDRCLINSEVDDHVAVELAGVKRRASMAGAAAAFGIFVSFRTTSRSSFMFNGHGTETITQSADFPGLIGGGLAIMLALWTLLDLARMRLNIDDEHARKSMQKQRLLLMLGVVLLVALGGWVLADSLPSETTIKH